MLPLLLVLGLGAGLFFLSKHPLVDRTQPSTMKYTDPPKLVHLGQTLQIVFPPSGNTENWGLAGVLEGPGAPKPMVAGQDSGSALMYLAVYENPTGKVFAFRAQRPGRTALSFVNMGTGRQGGGAGSETLSISVDVAS